MPGDSQDFFEAIATRYDAAYDAPTSDGHALRARMDVVVRLAGEGPGEALDAGMGPGRLCAELDARGWTIHGVDGAAPMVVAARDRLPHAADRLLEGDIEELPFPDDSFDLVVATGVIEYVSARAALAELMRVLRPGGRAVVSYPNPYALYGLWKSRVFYPLLRATKRVLRVGVRGMPRGAGPIAPSRFRGLLVDLGFAVDAVHHAAYLIVPSPADLLLPSLAARLGQRLEGSGGRARAFLATQIVYAARTPATEPQPPLGDDVTA